MSTPVSIDTSQGVVQALLQRPAAATWLYVFAHGAGAGMRHAFMQNTADRLGRAGIATLRYEYPYVTAGSSRPAPAPKLEAVTREVARYAAREFPDLRLFAGGKSMGGRMTSRAQAEEPLDRVEGIVFFGFPLHNPGSPSTSRAEHLAAVKIPLLFLQGTRDTLADLEMIKSVTADHPKATLHIVDTADHSFAVLKRGGRTADEAHDDMIAAISDWLRTL
jgi:predicted alpha/beta-hydrolase family hydrolase